MRFRLKEIGATGQTELALGDFKIIAGRNNTGKSYLVLTLYGFLTEFRVFLCRPAGQLIGLPAVGA